MPSDHEKSEADPTLSLTAEDWNILIEAVTALASRDKFAGVLPSMERQTAVATTMSKISFRVSLLSDRPIDVPESIRLSHAEAMRRVETLTMDKRYIESLRQILYGIKTPPRAL